MTSPRPYQQEAIDALDTYVREKSGNPAIVIPTGGGKSLMIAWAIAKWLKECPWFRCVILAHRKELVEQNLKEFENILVDEGLSSSGMKVGVFASSLRKRDYEAQILFASIDSIFKRSGEFAPFDAIMIDEAHRIPPSGEGKYITFLNGCKRFNPAIKLIGWTATPYRMNCGPICHADHMLNEVCYEASVVDLINDGYLSNLRSKVGVSIPDLSKVRRQSKGDYVLTSLAKATNRKDVVAKAVEEAVRIICREDRSHIVFFCVDVAHCLAVSDELAKYGIHAPAVTGKTKPDVRSKIGEDFKSGIIHAICNVNVYTEGFNATCVDCIVLLRPTLSAGLFSQMVGRGLRLHEGKRNCLILDFAGCIDEHGPIDLLGLGRVVMATCGDCRESFSRAIRKCPHCGWVIPKEEIKRLEQLEETERRMHNDKASQAAILSGEPVTYEVDNVFASRHCKPDKPDSLLIRYRCGAVFFREWICLDHPDFAGKKAHQWWRARFGSSKDKPTVNDALEGLFFEQSLRDWTKTITVKRNGKYKEVIGYNQPIGV